MILKFRITLHQIFFHISIDSINQKGYGWFLDNLVNNNFGGWPLIIGSNNFTEKDFDPSIVAGI